MSEATPWGKLAGLAGAVVVMAGLTFWGVPYYIKAQVHTEVKTELEAAGVDAIEDTSNGNQATVQAVLTRLDSIEERMIARDAMFVAYLERQAELARQRGQ